LFLGISWQDHVSNEDLLDRTKVNNLHDTVDKKRKRFIGHFRRLPSARPAVKAAVLWTTEDGGKDTGLERRDRTRCVMAMDVSWEKAKSVASDSRKWRSLVIQCYSGNRRT